MGVLADRLAGLLDGADEALDVGCGSGAMAVEIMRRRPGITLHGTDVVVRPEARIPVAPFAQGGRLPYADRSVPIVLLGDVVHHAEEPFQLLSEAARVADRAVVLKDVMLSDPLAFRTLRFMDIVANRRYEVPIPFSFWTHQEWRQAFERLGLRPTVWIDRLGLYPLPFRPLFERGMHFVTRLERTP